MGTKGAEKDDEADQSGQTCKRLRGLYPAEKRELVVTTFRDNFGQLTGPLAAALPGFKAEFRPQPKSKQVHTTFTHEGGKAFQCLKDIEYHLGLKLFEGEEAEAAVRGDVATAKRAENPAQHKADVERLRQSLYAQGTRSLTDLFGKPAAAAGAAPQPPPEEPMPQASRLKDFFGKPAAAAGAAPQPPPEEPVAQACSPPQTGPATEPPAVPEDAGRGDAPTTPPMRAVAKAGAAAAAAGSRAVRRKASSPPQTGPATEPQAVPEDAGRGDAPTTPPMRAVAKAGRRRVAAAAAGGGDESAATAATPSPPLGGKARRRTRITKKASKEPSKAIVARPQQASKEPSKAIVARPQQASKEPSKAIVVRPQKASKEPNNISEAQLFCDLFAAPRSTVAEDKVTKPSGASKKPLVEVKPKKVKPGKKGDSDKAAADSEGSMPTKPAAPRKSLASQALQRLLRAQRGPNKRGAPEDGDASAAPKGRKSKLVAEPAGAPRRKRAAKAGAKAKAKAAAGRSRRARRGSTEDHHAGDASGGSVDVEAGEEAQQQPPPLLEEDVPAGSLAHKMVKWAGYRKAFFFVLKRGGKGQKKERIQVSVPSAGGCRTSALRVARLCWAKADAGADRTAILRLREGLYRRCAEQKASQAAAAAAAVAPPEDAGHGVAPMTPPMCTAPAAPAAPAAEEGGGDGGEPAAATATVTPSSPSGGKVRRRTRIRKKGSHDLIKSPPAELPSQTSKTPRRRRKAAEEKDKQSDEASKTPVDPARLKKVKAGKKGDSGKAAAAADAEGGAPAKPTPPKKSLSLQARLRLLRAQRRPNKRGAAEVGGASAGPEGCKPEAAAESTGPPRKKGKAGANAPASSTQRSAEDPAGDASGGSVDAGAGEEAQPQRPPLFEDDVAADSLAHEKVQWSEGLKSFFFDLKRGENEKPVRIQATVASSGGCRTSAARVARLCWAEAEAGADREAILQFRAGLYKKCLPQKTSQPKEKSEVFRNLLGEVVVITQSAAGVRPPSKAFLELELSDMDTLHGDDMNFYEKELKLGTRRSMEERIARLEQLAQRTTLPSWGGSAASSKGTDSPSSPSSSSISPAGGTAAKAAVPWRATADELLTKLTERVTSGGGQSAEFDSIFLQAFLALPLEERKAFSPGDISNLERTARISDGYYYSFAERRQRLKERLWESRAHTAPTPRSSGFWKSWLARAPEELPVAPAVAVPAAQPEPATPQAADGAEAAVTPPAADVAEAADDAQAEAADGAQAAVTPPAAELKVPEVGEEPAAEEEAAQPSAVVAAGGPQEEVAQPSAAVAAGGPQDEAAQPSAAVAAGGPQEEAAQPSAAVAADGPQEEVAQPSAAVA